jgi:uncharacterized membrane protein
LSFSRHFYFIKLKLHFMNASQVHLALTHVPVVLSLTGMAVLLVSLFIKNQTVSRVAFYLLLAAGLFTIPVFFTGEGAEEIAENLPGVSEPLIEAHEEIAKYTIYAVLIAAAGALFGLLRLKPALRKAVYYFVLVTAIVTTALMVQTAHLGGQIRHSEIRQGTLAELDPAGNDGEEEEEDD